MSNKRITITDQDGIRIHTISLPERPFPVGTKCSARMAIGKRTGYYNLPGMTLIKSKSQFKPCPNNATRLIEGDPFCDMHGPD